jgi:hypothetical protein
MPYNTFDSDTTASQAGTANTSLDGLNVAEGWSAANANAAVRMLMANIRAMWNVVSTPASSIYTGFMLKAGGAFTGDITRNGRGGYLHNANPAHTGGKRTIQPIGGGFPAGGVEGDDLVEV